MSTDAGAEIALSVIAGPTQLSFSFDISESPVEIGRLSTLACRLDDPTVSRRHAVLRHGPGGWMLEDLKSRGGTAHNGALIDHPVRVVEGDEIGIGPWRLLATTNVFADSTITLSDDMPGGGALRTSPRRISQPLAARRLSLLLDYADRLQRAGRESELAVQVLDAACKGARFTQGAVVRSGTGGSVAEMLAQEGTPSAVSRSVLREAQKGQVVRLQDAPELMEAQSLMIGGVRDVLCVPINHDDVPYAFLYLIRETARDEADDDADFCVALVRLAEIALASLRRRGLEREIQAAREAQERILPDDEGSAPGLTYAMLSRAGRGVAGDLFDVVEIDERRTAILLGDITGKGAGPGLLMTAAQAFLNGELRRSESLLATIEALNAYISTRSKPGEFLTLWIGIWDSATRRIEYIDAGHGFAAHVPQEGEPRLLLSDGGPPLGISTEYDWSAADMVVGEGDQLVLFSDGLVEQSDPKGEMYTVERVLKRLAQPMPPTERVTDLADAVVAHAAGAVFTDDLTLACVSF